MLTLDACEPSHISEESDRCYMQRLKQGFHQIIRKPMGIVWLLFGFLFIVAGLMISRLIERSTDSLLGSNPQCSWPSTKGTITGSELNNYVRMNGEDDWQFTVKFAYEIEARQYSAEQKLRDFLVVEVPDIPAYAQISYLFQACKGLPTAADATELFRAAHDKSQFFPGRPVVVYFNPANSNEAVLAPGLVSGYAMTYGEGAGLYCYVILLIGGIIMMIRGILVVRQRSAA